MEANERAFERATTGIRREHRLFCPRCRAATMVTHQRSVLVHCDCAKCGLSTRRFFWFTPFVFVFGAFFTFLAEVIVGMPVPLLTLSWVAALAVYLAFDVGSRLRYRRATPEEIDAADDAVREARIVSATEAAVARVRIEVSPGAVLRAEAEDATELAAAAPTRTAPSP